MLPDQTPEVIETTAGIASINSVYSSDSCAEDEARHLDHKGEPLIDVMGWPCCAGHRPPGPGWCCNAIFDGAEPCCDNCPALEDIDEDEDAEIDG